ncbi:fucolectin-like [Heptranchias perlo]|uniref:fucolectin-like n=1 Tax=Heptranchias perlo TaxID=212740 RepID=UPI00355A4532
MIEFNVVFEREKPGSATKILDLDPNVALNGVASQPSNHKSAKAAIDGKPERLNRCSYTDSENNPWWRADLLQTHQISSIKITNTEKNSKEGIDGADIRTITGTTTQNIDPVSPPSLPRSLAHSAPFYSRCATVKSIELGAAETFDWGGMQGRFVNVMRRGSARRLTLCEVEVFGHPLFIIEVC